MNGKLRDPNEQRIELSEETDSIERIGSEASDEGRHAHCQLQP